MTGVTWVAVGAGRLALSNRPKLKTIAKLAEQGCQRIVTIQGRNEMPNQMERAALEAGIAWTWIEVGHGKQPAPDADRLLRRGLQEVATALEEGESVAVHCSAGIHRTGMFAFALLRWFGASEAEALNRLGVLRQVTRDGVRPEHLAWGNGVVRDAGRG